MGRQRPRSVTNAIRAQAALVVASGLTTLLTIVQRDDLIASWAARHSPGTEAPAFVPVAIVSFVTYALLAWMLVVFFRDGHPSARYSLTGLAAFFLFTMVVVYRIHPPVEFIVLAALSGALCLVVLYFLWHRDTTEFLSGAALADELDG
jgi:hypothetical protein